jgi:hypothetical protein
MKLTDACKIIVPPSEAVAREFDDCVVDEYGWPRSGACGVDCYVACLLAKTFNPWGIASGRHIRGKAT